MRQKSVVRAVFFFVPYQLYREYYLDASYTFFESDATKKESQMKVKHEKLAKNLCETTISTATNWKI